MTLVLPVRTYSEKRLRRFFNAWATLALGWTSDGAAAAPTRRVHQADGGDPRPGLPYMSYQRLAGPSPALDGQDALWVGEVPTSVNVTVTTAVVGDSTTLLVNQARVTRELLLGETTEDQRDALLVLIAATVEPVTCTASGSTGILVSPDYPGDLQSVTAVEGCTVVTTVGIREMLRGIRTWRYRVQLHAGSDASDTGSGWIDIDQCADVLLTVLHSTALTQAATSLQVSRFGPRLTPQRTSVQSGGRIEQRVFFDVNLSMITRLVSTTEPIAIDSVAPPAISLV